MASQATGAGKDCSTVTRPIPIPSGLCCHAPRIAGPFPCVPRAVAREVGHAWSPYPHQRGTRDRINEGAGPEPGGPLCLETRRRGGHRPWSPLAVLERGPGASRGCEGYVVTGSQHRGPELPLGLDRRYTQSSLTSLPPGTRGGSELPHVHWRGKDNALSGYDGAD